MSRVSVFPLSRPLRGLIFFLFFCYLVVECRRLPHARTQAYVEPFLNKGKPVFNVE